MKRAIVSGANSGIGKITAMELSKKGFEVILACRNIEKGKRAIADILKVHSEAKLELLVLDLGEQDAIDQFAEHFYERYDSLDLLVNNAGIWSSERNENSKGFESMFAVNHLGSLYLTYKMLPALLKRNTEGPSARIVNVSSNAHRWAGSDFSDLQWTRRSWSSKNAYGFSKMANIWFTKSLAQRLPSHVTVNALHPGVISTNLGDGLVGTFFKLASPFLKTPEQGAQTQIFLSSSIEVEGKSGGYYADKKEKEPNRLARDAQLAEKMWKISNALLEISFEDNL